MQSISTERLILRPITLGDVDDLFEYHRDPHTVQFIPWPVRSYNDVQSAVASYPQTMVKLEAKADALVLGWLLRDTNKIIGQSNMTLISKANNTADIGWVTHPDYVRQGFAFEATCALIQWAFDVCQIHRVVANIDIRNPESAALAEKLGMRLEGEFKQAVFTKGQWCDMWQYAILHTEFDRLT